MWINSIGQKENPFELLVSRKRCSTNVQVPVIIVNDVNYSAGCWRVHPLVLFCKIILDLKGCNSSVHKQSCLKTLQFRSQYFLMLQSLYFVGAGRFYDNLEVMLGFKILPWFKICWMGITPLACGVSYLVFVLSCYVQWVMYQAIHSKGKIHSYTCPLSFHS